jgi:hypothetical protein
MFELSINDVVYSFKFGIGFVREINKRVTREVEGMSSKQEIGLQMAVAGLIDEDPVALVDILDLANKTEKPRVTRNALDSYIEDESTDINALFAEVLDFLKNANATKTTVAKILKAVEAEMEKTAL